jgi:PTS system ascorbate-specific IIA component
MVGILILAHGSLGDSLIHFAAHVMGGRPPRLLELGVTVNDDPTRVLPRALGLASQLDSGSGVLVLTDMYGATPSNIAARLLAPGRVEGLAGVNLPMLVRALT